ncbi:WAP-type 'four-disulfide core [Oesophagostomum dentatum]|uniref:WAP-type 'four-disulfide core n=1 Tax=Oesophagostomum dentatum TaxID=61180 RepID=A0A0B1TCU1_OESDE|nr:WAP-type 'four-disulfide core [Oesophagostomum dentatum]
MSYFSLLLIAIAPRALPKPSRDKPLTTESSPTDADELCPDGSVWTKRCRQEGDCNTAKEVCAEGKCCATCARQRRAFLDNSAQSELVGLAIPQCEADGRYYRMRQCLAGTEACWCVTPLGRRIVGGGPDCETRRRMQENIALKAVKLRDELKRGKICDEYREGDCPDELSNNSTVHSCLCDSDCPSGQKCCHHRRGLTCQMPGTNQL